MEWNRGYKEITKEDVRRQNKESIDLKHALNQIIKVINNDKVASKEVKNSEWFFNHN